MSKIGMGFGLGVLLVVSQAMAAELKLGEPAPLFTAKTQSGSSFDLASRKGHWTVLFFYPKAGTPGCTKQACAFRDGIGSIRKLGAEVYGISADSVEDQARFHKEHHLSFDLLADDEGKIIALYGSKMPVMKMSKRWTFILDPELRISAIEKDIDPALDSTRVAKALAALQKKP